MGDQEAGFWPGSGLHGWDLPSFTEPSGSQPRASVPDRHPETSGDTGLSQLDREATGFQ